MEAIRPLRKTIQKLETIRPLMKKQWRQFAPKEKTMDAIRPQGKNNEGNSPPRKKKQLREFAP